MKDEKISLSAIVITRNSGKKIRDCLLSLRFVDEIVVVDSGSTDETIEIAKEIKARVFSIESKGYSYSRNVGAQKARGEWLLYVDSDERISDALKRKIEIATSSACISYAESVAGRRTPRNDFTSYRIYRKNIILGKWLKYGGWWPDPVHRLIKKSSLRQWVGELHEYPVVSGDIGMIEEPIVHLSKDSISDMVKNSREFAPIEARLKLQAKHPQVRLYHFIIAMWREFWNRGIVKTGWLDGPIGVVEVFYQMFHQLLVYSALWEMQRK